MYNAKSGKLSWLKIEENIEAARRHIDSLFEHFKDKLNTSIRFSLNRFAFTYERNSV